jgi:trk system potassium uptake protein TrkA
MKYIIIGLGNFGASLAEKLTREGNEVIGIDNNMSKVEAYKEVISHTICMDSTDQFTMSGLPLSDTDVVIVAIGEDKGANILTTAILKNLKAKRLISRAINPLHETVLEAIGVDEIVHPEEETAERLAKRLCFEGVLDSFEVTGDYSIVEMSVPPQYYGKSLAEIGFRRKHNVVVLTTIRVVEEKNIFGITRKVKKVGEVASPQTVLQPNDIMIIYGENKDIRALLELTEV